MFEEFEQELDEIEEAPWQRITREQWMAETDRVVEAGLKETDLLRGRVKALEANVRTLRATVEELAILVAKLDE